MKNLFRVSILIAALALAGTSGGWALGRYRPGDCVYVCENQAGETVTNKASANPSNCCSGNYPHICPAGYSWSYTDFYVDSFGPELCP